MTRAQRLFLMCCCHGAFCRIDRHSTFDAARIGLLDHLCGLWDAGWPDAMAPLHGPAKALCDAYLARDEALISRAKQRLREAVADYLTALTIAQATTFKQTGAA